MSTLTAILLGVLIGWLLEWGMDWLYWRKQSINLKDLKAENAALQAKLEELSQVPDDFQLIKGVGPQIEQRLHAAGITTYQQLGKLSPSKLEPILGNHVKHLIDEVDILEQSREFAKQKIKGANHGEQSPLDFE
jgi:predicted flap endonuclease-1-like 5' DNA nuclease